MQGACANELTYCAAINSVPRFAKRSLPHTTSLLRGDRGPLELVTPS